MKADNPYEASAQPAASSRADLPAGEDNPSKANEFDLTSYGVLGTAVVLGLFGIRSIIGGGFTVCLYLFGLFRSPEDSLFLNSNMFHEAAVSWLGRGLTRFVLGILALCIVWHCRTLFLELRAVSRRETTAKALVQPQRKCWTLLAIFLALCAMVVIFGPFFFGMSL